MVHTTPDRQKMAATTLFVYQFTELNINIFDNQFIHSCYREKGPSNSVALLQTAPGTGQRLSTAARCLAPDGDEQQRPSAPGAAPCDGR